MEEKYLDVAERGSVDVNACSVFEPVDGQTRRTVHLARHGERESLTNLPVLGVV